MDRSIDYVLGFVIIVSLVGLAIIEGCGTDRSNQRSTAHPSSLSVDIDLPSKQELKTNTVEVCNYTKLNKRRIRRFLCKKRKNKKACRRKVNRLLNKSKRFPKVLEDASE